MADHGVERAVRVRRGRGGENGARSALVDEQIFQLRVREEEEKGYVVGEGTATGVVHLQIVHFHDRLVDVHQLLELQLLARVRQLAELAAMLEVRFQLVESLQYLAVRLVLLSQSVVLVLVLSELDRTKPCSEDETPNWGLDR